MMIFNKILLANFLKYSQGGTINALFKNNSINS
jgi:hypothetical protein